MKFSRILFIEIDESGFTAVEMTSGSRTVFGPASNRLCASDLHNY